jgi:general L-amino acid transport system permease protein
MTGSRTPSQASPRAFWNDPRFRAILSQVLVVAAVAAIAVYLVSNTMHRLEQQAIATGFGFLNRQAGFGIGEHLIDYSPTDTYLQAFLVGLLNTFQVALIGIVLATLLGIVMGIARLSSNWLVAKLASGYVETVRNIPLLLQLFLWYSLLTEFLPHPRQALNPIPGVYLSSRGLNLPFPEVYPGDTWVALGLSLAIGLLGAALARRWVQRRRERSGQAFPLLPLALSLVLGLPLAVFLSLGASLRWNVPQLQGFNFRGGMTLSPEFAALLLGLTLYTAGFIAETVRSGILSVGAGQKEAARALGLGQGLTLRLIILPQALRVIVPPLTSQYLNLTKNSSLAVAIGYPDLVSIANTTINQTGQAVEGIVMIMATYLTISLSIAAFMNGYNRRIALKER